MSHKYSAFSLSELQAIRTFMVVASRNNPAMTVAEAVADITAVLEREAAATSRRGELAQPSVGVEVCPSCGRGRVTRWHGSSAQAGADVFGCAVCHWSEVR